MRGSDIIVAPSFKWLEPMNPEGRLGDDGSPVSGDSTLIEGFVLRQVFHNVLIFDAYQHIMPLTCRGGGYLVFFQTLLPL